MIIDNLLWEGRWGRFPFSPSKAAFPESALLGLTDEQFIRNVVDSLYRGQAA